MTLTIFFIRLLQLALSASLLLLGHYGYAWLAVGLALVPPVVMWVRGNRTPEALSEALPVAIFGASIAILISLSKPPVGQSVLPVMTQVGLAAIYGTWLITYGRLSNLSTLRLILAGAIQFTAIIALFLAAAFWRWPEILVVTYAWAVSFGTAWWYLSVATVKANAILAATWGLVVAQISWVLFYWQVNYILGAEGFLVIPQAAIIIVGLGYCMASVYVTHAQKQLSRRRLIEYVAISGILLAIVIAGTRWNGTT